MMIQNLVTIEGEAFEGGTFGGIPEIVSASGQGGNFEGGTFRETLEYDNVQASEQVLRPRRIRKIPKGFAEFDMLQDTEIDFEGEVIQLSMLVDSEPVSTEESLKKKVWLKVVNEKLEAIERNKT